MRSASIDGASDFHLARNKLTTPTYTPDTNYALIKLHLLYERDATSSVKLYSRMLLNTTLPSCKAEPRHILENNITQQNVFMHVKQCNV